LQNKLQQNSNRTDDFYNSMKAKNILKKMAIDSFGNYIIQKLTGLMGGLTGLIYGMTDLYTLGNQLILISKIM